MLSIELAVLQTLDHSDWHTLSEISTRTRIQEQTAAETLKDLNKTGIVEFRTNTSGSDSGSEVIEWRSRDHSLENYLKDKTPC